jgi:excisionase family DNA binding protein
MAENTPVSFRLADRLALTVAEAARVLGVSERHIRNLLPELPHVYLGGRPVIPVDPLKDWLATQAKAEQGRVDATVEEFMQSFDRKRRESH